MRPAPPPIAPTILAMLADVPADQRQDHYWVIPQGQWSTIREQQAKNVGADESIMPPHFSLYGLDVVISASTDRIHLLPYPPLLR